MRALKIICLVMTLIVILSGCSVSTPMVTKDEIIQAYEQAGYKVSAGMYDSTLEHGITGYIKAEQPNGDYIYFSIFESAEEAQAYKDASYHPGILGLFSAIYGDPSWVRWQVYGDMVIEYDQPEFYDIFENLLKTK